MKIVPNDTLSLSLWLLPPTPVRENLAEEIAQLSSNYGDCCSAPFVPHVTVVGNIPCGTTKDDAIFIGEKLKRALENTGAVPCRFRNEPCVSMRSAGVVCWSQACIAIMERSDEYMNLLKKARATLDMAVDEPSSWFAPPARDPHFSFLYGCASIPEMIDPPPDFVAEQAALWITSPLSVEGVGQWSEVTRFDLFPRRTRTKSC